MNSASSLTPSVKNDLLAVAARVFWWGTPEEALLDINRFVAQVMTYGDWDAVCKTISLLGKQVFREVIDHPPAGVFDEKSWTYWHAFFGRLPAPPLPKRRL